MTAWNIDEMRDAVTRRSCFVIGGSFDEICDYVDLPETSDEAGPTQANTPAPAGVLVDIQTANAIVTVYDALSEANRAKFTALSVDRAADVAWKLVAR